MRFFGGGVLIGVGRRQPSDVTCDNNMDEFSMHGSLLCDPGISPGQGLRILVVQVIVIATHKMIKTEQAHVIYMLFQ